MDSIVNYESDDGNLKLTKKSSSKVIIIQHWFNIENIFKIFSYSNNVCIALNLKGILYVEKEMMDS